MLHFVAFRDDRYWNAVRVFGRPDFVHRKWDLRANREIAPNDVLVFASGQVTDCPDRRNGDDLTEPTSPE